MELNKPDWLVQMEGILETLNEGVFIVDDCNHIIYVNDALAQMVGQPASEALGRTPGHFYSGEDLEFLNSQIARNEAEGRNRYEFHVPRADGSRLPVVISARVIEDPDGRQFSVISCTNISEQKQVQRQLSEANALLAERQREIEIELALAARVQQSLAPQALEWGRVAVETFYLPVRTIGGDFGLVTPLGDTQLNLLVCDVSGHGIGSALVANRIYSETMSLLERRAALGDMLRRLNRFVLDHIQTVGFFFSMAALRVNQSGNHLTYAGAGHPPAVWATPGGESRLLQPRSGVLGLLEEAVADDPVEEIELRPGDRVVLYTDGISEAMDHRGEQLGSEGLQEIVRHAACLPLAEMKQTILDKVQAWRHGPVTDDVSLVLLETR